jgi:hypothetical protein
VMISRIFQTLSVVSSQQSVLLIPDPYSLLLGSQLLDDL